MPSTYSSNLKIELMSTGENSGTWGNITNTNLGTAMEQAVVGYGNPDYTSDANLTITLSNSNAAQAARALVLNVTSAFGSLTATRELVVPTTQKQYIVQNNTTGGQSITVKTSAGTGITVPNGRKAHLYVDGTNVIQMFDFVDINGGAIDGTTIGASSASTGAFTTLNASGATTLDGNVTLGNASGDNVTVTGTITSNLLFTDNTYDIGASGATRPRNLFLAGAATIGGNLSVGGTLTLTGGVNLNGNVTVGDTSADTLTINSTITSNLIFTDNTYDIGASGATRPRNLFLAGSATISGSQTLTGALTVDSTTDSSSTTTGSIQTDGGLGVAKAAFIGTNLNVAGNTTLGDAAADTVTVNGTVTSNLIFTDNTYDIGAAGATRPRTAYFGTSVVTPYLSASTSASSNTGPTSGGVFLSSNGVSSGYYSPSITFDIGGGGGGAKLYTSRLNAAGGRFYINTDATNGTSYNRLLITEDGEWYWYNNNVTTGAQAMSLTGSNLVVSGQIQSNLEDGLVSTAQNAANNGIYLQVRPYSGQSGYLTFTENAVADRWAIGIQPGDGTLYFRNAQVTGTAVAKLSSSGQLTLGNVTQYSTSALTIPANAAVSQPTFTIRDIDSLGADAYRGAGGNIQFRSATSFANNGAQGTMFLAARNYGSAPGSANDSTEKVGLWIKGYYDNLGTPLPLYLGGYGYAGVDYVLQIDQNRNLGVLIDPAPWAWPNGTAGALQLQSGAAFSGYNAGTYLSQNWYYNSGEKYIANGYATRYVQGSGGHYFYTAGNNSAGAGANLSWGVEKFSSDANGVFRINSNTASAAGNNLIIGNGNVTANNIVTINTGDQNYAALNLSNWDGSATTYGPRIGFDNSGRGGWTIGSSDGRNNFEISRSWGTPDFTVGSTGASFFGGSYSYGGASAGVINLTGYGAPSIGFQAVANGALRAYLQHNVTGGGYGEMALYVGGDNNTNASQVGWYVANNGKFLTQRTTSRSELGANVDAQIGDMPIISLSGGDTSPLDTGISVNQYSAGCTMLMLWSVNTSAGQNTSSAVYMIKFYYDGNYTPAATLIAGTGSVTFGISGSNTLTVQGVPGNNAWMFIGNR